MEELKQCNVCRRVKLTSEFHRHKRTKDGLQNICKECRAAYHAAHREEKAAYDQNYHAKNRERIAAQRQDYREAHREELADKQRARYEENPEKAKAHRQRRRALERGATTGEIDYDVIWLRDRGRCCVCSLKVDRILKYPHPMSLSFDHTIPLSLSGPHTQENLRVCHLHCNLERGAGWLPVQMVLA